jgi:hypothetical protein
MTLEQVKKEVVIPKELASRYLGKSFEFENILWMFDPDYLRRCILIYGKAIEYATEIYNKYIAPRKWELDFEISIDETHTSTSPLQHFFVANELLLNNVKFDTIAPRFCGEFQKGIDYIGDLKKFEDEFKVHAAIARKFGYKLSIHSGSDKFSIYKIIGKYTGGNFHLKTAGTNWLEAMRVVAVADPKLYRAIHKFALSKFAEAKKYYVVTTDISKIPNIDTLSDEQLVSLFAEKDSRQLIHITYGFILTEKDEKGKYLFRDKLYKLWTKNEVMYKDMPYDHIGKHLELLYSGFGGEKLHGESVKLTLIDN